MDFSRKGKNSRIARALPHFYSQLRDVRELNAELIADDCGSRYPGRIESYGDILNLMQRARLAMSLSMAASCPRFLATTHSSSRATRAFADKCGRALNAWSPRIRLQQTLQTIVGDAFFSLGIGKSYMADSLPIQLENDVYINPGMPFFSARSIDHIVWDTAATDFRYSSIFADRYQASFEQVMEETRIKPAIRNKLFRQGPDSPSQEALSEIITDTGSNWFNENAQVNPWLYFAEAYDPKERIVSTWLVGDTFEPRIDEPLFEMEWDGRPEGPYHFLNLGYIPHRTVPSSPAQNLSNLHNFINTLLRKLQDQAERMKQVTVSQSGDEEDAEKMRVAPDGSHVTLGNSESAKQIRLDGPDQNLFTLMLSVNNLYSSAANNLESRLGLGASADTARQEQMIGSQVSRLEGYFQQQFVDFVREVGREQFKMLFTDAATEIPMSLEIPGTKYRVRDDWLGAYEEGSRYGTIDEFEIDLEPHSMAYKSPGQRLGELDARIDRMMPMEPLLNQRGKGFNVEKYLEVAARYSNLPELTELYEPITPMQPSKQGAPGLLAGAGQREYIHRNVSGGSGGVEMPQMQMTGPGGQSAA